MPIDVRLSEPQLIDELIAAFIRTGNLVHRLDDASCRVAYVKAASRAQARKELQFFVRAWQLEHPGVSAVVSAG